METPIDAGGLNRAEASFLAAAVRRGDAADLVDAVESGPARALRARLEAVEPLGAAARRRCAAELVDAAESDDPEGPLRPVLLADDERHLDTLLTLDEPALLRTARAFGAFQVAELVRGRNRREIARVAGRMAPARRSAMFRALRRDRDCDRRECLRIREAFVAVSREVEAFAERLARLGLYCVASAAGRRYRERIARLAERLSAEIGSRLRSYYRTAHGRPRYGVGRQFRRSLVEFLDCHADADRRVISNMSGGDDE